MNRNLLDKSLFLKVQSLYHHPSLGTPIDLTIVYIEIMKSQPIDMPHYNGERSLLLDSFCDYQKNKNPADDRNPNHWDMGLYISGYIVHSIFNQFDEYNVT